MAEDITPKHLRCAVHSSCPSVHVRDDGRLLIVGEVIKDGDCVWFKEGEPSAHVGPNEAAVVISADLLSELPEVKRLREVVREFLVMVDDSQGSHTTIWNRSELVRMARAALSEAKSSSPQAEEKA